MAAEPIEAAISSSRNLLLNSGGLAGHPEGVPAIVGHLKGCRRVAFIPYALADHDGSLALMKSPVPGVNFVSVHTAEDPASAIASADGIWVMGGNSFRLVDELHRRGLIGPVRAAVAGGIPYGGASAGANVAGPTICTTNDMPIRRHQTSLDSFELVPFQINPHYLDADALPPGFRGETREQRLAEFLEENDVPVIGLREGTWLTVRGSVMRLEGSRSAVLFERGKKPREMPAGSDLSHLLTVVPRFNMPQSRGISL
jgi:dipeptidase E